MTGIAATAHHSAGCCSTPRPVDAAAAAICPAESVTCRTSRPSPKKPANAGSSPSMSPSEMLEAKPEMCAHEIGPAAGPCGAEKSADAGVVTHGGVHAMQDKGVFCPSGDDAGRKQQDAGDCRVKRGRPRQRKRFQRGCGMRGVEQRPLQRQLGQQRDAHHRRHHRPAHCPAPPPPASARGSRPRRRNRSPRRPNRCRAAAPPWPAPSSRAAWWPASGAAAGSRRSWPHTSAPRPARSRRPTGPAP